MYFISFLGSNHLEITVPAILLILGTTSHQLRGAQQSKYLIVSQRYHRI